MNKCTCDLHDNIDESVEQVKSWNKYGLSERFPWAELILVGLIIGIIIAMIFANVPPTI